MYKAWENMKSRCYNPYFTGYKHYGGRGIKVCVEWENSFPQFLMDMGVPPKGLSLDRIDVNGDYCKENCRWATPKEQANNTRSTTFVNGRPLQIVAEEAGLNPRTLHYRVKANWKDLLKKVRRPLYTYNGVTDSLSGWAKRLDIDLKSLWKRIDRGEHPDRVFRPKGVK